MNIYYTVYQTTNQINDKIYIGVHKTENPNDSYLGSNRILKDAIKKYGKENFTKEVLFVFDNEESMWAKEKELVNEDFVSRKDTYNIGQGGEGWTGLDNM
jgi:dissimilatory sulfite reductase (desulfoviridin) alpha/beta subunit